MVPRSQAQDCRVNLNRVDVADAPLQSAAHVIAGAGANHERVPERLTARIAREEVRKAISKARSMAVLRPHHGLVIDQIHADLLGRKIFVIDPVIGRPQMLPNLASSVPLNAGGQRRQYHDQG